MNYFQRRIRHEVNEFLFPFYVIGLLLYGIFWIIFGIPYLLYKLTRMAFRASGVSIRYERKES